MTLFSGLKAIAVGFCSVGLSYACAAEPQVLEVAGPRMLAAAYENPVLDEHAYEVHDLTVAQGHMTLALLQGKASVVRVNGEVVGLFFAGKGTMSYLATDPSEQPVLKFNLKRHTGLEAQACAKGLLIEDTVKNVMLWAGGIALPALKGPVAPQGLAAEFKDQHAAFAHRNWSCVGNLMVSRAANAPALGLMVAEVTGGKHLGIFQFDDALARKESYSAAGWSDVASPTGLDRIPLSEAFLLGSRNNPLDPDFLVDAVDLDIHATAGSAVSLTVVENVIPLRSGIQVLGFNLDSNRYYWRGGWYGVPLLVKRVCLDSGEPVPFEHHCDQLLVQMRTPLPIHTPLKIKFEISGDFLFPHGGDNYWELGVDDWFPHPDLAGQAYKVHCRLAVDNPFLPVVPGTVLKEETTATQHVMETVIDKPVSFFAISGGKFASKEYRSPLTPVRVRLFGYAGLASGSAERLANTILGFISYYETFLGKFPCDTLNVVERNELGSGQAPTGTLYITREAFNPLKDVHSQIYAHAWINKAVAHEVAHQYWGNQVRMFGRDDQWITEAFAEYCAGLAMRQVKTNGQERFQHLLAMWSLEARTANTATTISHANWLAPREPGEIYFRQSIMYDKGALLLHAIHKELGDQNFANFLNTYLRAYTGKATITQDIPDLLKKLTGKEWDTFFKKYYWGTELPDLGS